MISLCSVVGMKVLSKRLARIYYLFILFPFLLLKVGNAYLRPISRNKVLSLTHPKQCPIGLIMAITDRLIQRHSLSVTRG